MEQNYEFLVNDLKYLGFDTSMNAELKEMLGTEADSFELAYQGKIQNEPISALLFFHRVDSEGYFFFSNYKLCLGVRQHTFYVFKGRGITVKEGYNLLCGRAVFKQRKAKNGQIYNEWIELDLNVKEENGFRARVYPESYGFDLLSLIDTMLIDTPSPNWDRSMLIRSLEKGNLQAAFIKQDGSHRKVYLSADPGERTIRIHEIESKPIEKVEETKMGDDIEDSLKRKPSKVKKIKDIIL
ncbi:MAG TPA: hypothetical protein VK772_14535 [Puia sp.]|jgi:hypothetical protein|nr:hypothetical protein [Puia sp.]